MEGTTPGPYTRPDGSALGNELRATGGGHCCVPFIGFGVLDWNGYGGLPDELAEEGSPTSTKRST